MAAKKKSESLEAVTVEKDYTPLKDPSAAESAGIQSPKFGPSACCLVSRMDQPMTISYEGQSVVLPPRAGSKHPLVFEDGRLLGALPKGVFKVPLPSNLRSK